MFSAAVGGVAPASALYAVWSGANDLFAIMSGSLPLGTLTPAQAATGAAGVATSAIVTLAAEGAKGFIVPLLPDLGKTPDATASGASAAATALSAAYNAANAVLVADVQVLIAGNSISVSLVDTFSLIDAAVSDPGAHGLTDVTDRCYTGPYTGGGSGCANPDQYLFWNGVHPTAAGQAIVAAAAQAALPEPGTLAILAFGLTGLAGLRIRRRPALLRPLCCDGATPKKNHKTKQVLMRMTRV
jgi:phospholipase/lecithinase/hemolysin